jgi:uncharacterized repeat protein (TIGR03847 family)
MTKPLNDFGKVSNVVADAIGKPGQRHFCLRVSVPDGRSATLWLEKEQLFELAIALTRLISDIEELQDSDQVSECETMSQTTPLGTKDLHLEFKAEDLSLSYRKELNLFALAVYVAESSDEDDAPDLYLTAETSVMEAMADGALEVCAAGRPLCSLCNAPIGEESHICPKQNGYARFGI